MSLKKQENITHQKRDLMNGSYHLSKEKNNFKNACKTKDSWLAQFLGFKNTLLFVVSMLILPTLLTALSCFTSLTTRQVALPRYLVTRFCCI